MRFNVVSAALCGAALFMPGHLWAASCCGGGSAASLVLPKYAGSMVDVSFDRETYDGLWRSDGKWVPDPPGSDLNQYRLNFGFAYRLAYRWQASVMLPYVFNDNSYSGLNSNTDGLGDAAIGFWYEAFDGVQCVWEVNSWKDLKPASYLGLSLNVPTGISPYDNVTDNFDITGRGFYRLDANALIEKTIFPWNMALNVSYGTHLERAVNREYGTAVDPYHRKMGDRSTVSIAGGYTHFTDTMHSITGALAYADLQERKAEIDGSTDPTSGLRKRSLAATIAWSTPTRDWVGKLSWNHALDSDGKGRNFPTTDILTLGVTRVFR